MTTPGYTPARLGNQPIVGVTELGQPIVVATPIVAGPQGPAGPPGNTPQSITLTAASDWNYTHDYPYMPEVRLIDPNGNWVGVGVQYPDAHTIYISFPVPFTGTVLLT